MNANASAEDRTLTIRAGVPPWDEKDWQVAESAWRRYAPEGFLLEPWLALAYQWSSPTEDDVARLLDAGGRGFVEWSQGELPDQAGSGGEGLWLEAIEIENFRLFKRAQASFRAGPDAPIALIEAPNGTGKSAFIMAVQHALGLIDPSTVEADQIVYKYAEREPVDVKVVMRFRSGSQGEIEVRRIGSYRRNRERRWVRDRDEDLIISLDQEVIRGAEASRWLADTFPPAVAAFFVFDAEKSRVVAELRGESGHELPPVRKQMEAVLGLQPLGELAAALDAYGRRASSERDSASKQLKKMEKERGRWIDEVRGKRDEASRLNAEVEALRAERNRIERDLMPLRELLVSDDPDRQQYVNQLREGLSLEREKLEQATRERSRLVAAMLPMAMLHLAVARAGDGAGKGEETDDRWRQGANHALTKVAKFIARGQLPWLRNPPQSDAIEDVLRREIGIPSDSELRRADQRRRVREELRAAWEPARQEMGAALPERRA